MKRKLCLLAALFALLAPVVLAGEMPHKPIQREFRVDQLPFAGNNFMEISNMDWIDYYVVVHMQQFRIEFSTNERGGRGRHGFWLPSGTKAIISSPLHVWQLEGETGNNLFVGIHENRTTPVRLVGFGDINGNNVGMAAILYDGGKDAGQMLINASTRNLNGLPPRPEPTPYYDPYPQQYGGGYPVPVIGQDPPYYDNDPHRIPVIGQDPPPYRNDPPHRIPVIGRDPPPAYTGPGPQNPPQRHHFGLPVQPPVRQPFVR